MKDIIERPWLSAIGIFVVMLITWVPLSAQETHTVSISGFAFVPSEITISAGDEVTWTNPSDSHNVNGTRATFPTNPESFGNSIGTGWSYSYQFEIAGEYDYRCDVHFGSGMTGKILVEGASHTLTLSFSEMLAHVGQLFKLYIRYQSNFETIDSIIVEELAGPDFQLQSDAIISGDSYYIDFFADMNENGSYDAPPEDHAWRIRLDEVSGDTTIEFTHNSNFTDISQGGTTAVDLAQAEDRLNVYPNPSNSHLYLDAGSMISEVKILTLSGVTIKRWPAQKGSSQTIQLDGIMPGAYLLRVNTTGKGLQSVPFIKY
ncbi:MAG: T9SS type A sorting domain-containing protein [Bacteroidales bacterium]|nr:T9SS type A sorting domain-containing protein [Bacteroidales bacterium]